MRALLASVYSPEFILRPLTFYALLAVGLGLCLYLFVTLKVEMRRLHRGRQDERRQVEDLEKALSEARLAVQALETDLRAVEGQTGMLVSPAPTRSGLNLSRRTQVLRMHRSGQDNAGIAAALALPRSEVDLLIKVHRIIVEQI